MNEVQAAVDGLEALGLTEYEARCFVALAELPHGTAKEIGQVADIPRSRVYETMDRLQTRGLVELHEADPRTYQSVPVDTAIEMLRNEYDDYFETVERSLHQLEPTYKKSEQAVWALNTREQVTGRVVDILEDAEDEVVFLVLDENLVDEYTADALAAAADRDVTVYVGTQTETVHDQLADAGVDATVFESDLVDWFAEMSGSPRIGRMLMADRGPVLVSAIHEEELPGVPNETAVWSDGIDHGFATFAERVLTYELTEGVGDAYDTIETE